MIATASQVVRRTGAQLRAHVGLVAVVLLGALVRIAVDLARGPAVYQDSIVFLGLAKNAPFSFSPGRPNGYPVLLRMLFFVTGRNLDVVTALHHLAGLAIVVLVYALLVRLGAPRWVAALTAGVIAVNSYTVALEQDVLSEAVFTLAVVASVYLLVATSRRSPELAASGLLLAVAVTMRVVAIFAVPFWVAYVMLRRPKRNEVVVALAAVAAPLLAYCSFHAAYGQGFGFTTADGWLLYGKIAPIADCSGASVPARTRPLCSGRRDQGTEYYLYARSSPAQVLFFGPTKPVDVEKAWNAENSQPLRDFSLAIIRAHPTAYARVVGREFFHYVGPNRPSVELTLYGKPGTLMQRYERWLHVPWWLVTSSVAAAWMALLLGGRPRSRTREAWPLIAMPLAMLVGTAATAPFVVRYMQPTVPLVVCAGGLALVDLASHVRLERRIAHK